MLTLLPKSLFFSMYTLVVTTFLSNNINELKTFLIKQTTAYPQKFKDKNTFEKSVER